jgi:hypothetical protein
MERAPIYHGRHYEASILMDVETAQLASAYLALGFIKLHANPLARCKVSLSDKTNGAIDALSDNGDAGSHRGVFHGSNRLLKLALCESVVWLKEAIHFVFFRFRLFAFVILLTQELHVSTCFALAISTTRIPHCSIIANASRISCHT